MNSISVSRAKQFHSCKLAYKYKYVDKWEPEVKAPADVTNKGLVMHETFEALTLYENYPEGSEEPTKAYRQATTEVVMAAFKKAMEENKLPIEVAEKYNLKRGIKRWLSFKHDYLDKRNTILYSEKRYDREIFTGVNTITILDLLEDKGDGNFVIYDYKTPQKANASSYKMQLMVYAYMMAIVKGLIEVGSTDYQTVADHFKCYIFFPLCDGDHEDYKDSLKECKFKAADVQKAIEDMQQTIVDVDAFDFTKSAEALQPAKPDFTCSWCDYCGSDKQADGFEGCPITKFAGYLSKGKFIKK